MRRSAPALLLTSAMLLVCVPALATGPLPSSSRPALSSDGQHVIEGTSVPSKWSWHLRLSLDGQAATGPARDSTLLRGRLSGGLAFPGRLALAAAMPVGGLLVGTGPWGEGSSHPSGVGPGDLEAALLWTILDSSERGALGLLIGAIAIFPTGDEDRRLGEAGFAAEPFVSLALEVLATRLSLNLAYHLRTARTVFEDFEQDDDVIWRIGLRVPRQDDVAWSLFAEGSVGVAAGEGLWPSRRSRPVFAGGGVDFPAGRHGRLSTYLEVGLDGATAPSALLSLSFQLGPVQPDEDQDHVGGLTDQCPVLKEDLDGFEDRDGCPDLDNDKDGFPDDEDRCPNQPAASDFSPDGC